MSVYLLSPYEVTVLLVVTLSFVGCRESPECMKSWVNVCVDMNQPCQGPQSLRPRRNAKAFPLG